MWGDCGCESGCGCEDPYACGGGCGATAVMVASRRVAVAAAAPANVAASRSCGCGGDVPGWRLRFRHGRLPALPGAAIAACSAAVARRAATTSAVRDGCGNYDYSATTTTAACQCNIAARPRLLLLRVLRDVLRRLCLLPDARPRLLCLGRPSLQLHPRPAGRPDRVSVLHGPRPARFPDEQPAVDRPVLIDRVGCAIRCWRRRPRRINGGLALPLMNSAWPPTPTNSA